MLCFVYVRAKETQYMFGVISALVERMCVMNKIISVQLSKYSIL